MAAAVHNYYELEAQFDAHIICADAVSVDTKKRACSRQLFYKKRNSLPTVAVEPELLIPQVCFLEID